MKNMMAKRLKLPSYYLVESWGKQQVLNWLRSFELDDCIPAFESREIDGPALLELTEERLFTFQDIKIKRRVQLTRCVNECKSQATQAKEQLTKCVNECKSQAMQAKGFVNSIRKPSQCKTKTTRNIQAEEENDFDCWDDFDDDDEEEEEGEFNLEQNSELPRKNTLPELINYSSTPESTMQNSELCSQVLSAELNSGSSQYADNIQINNSKPEISEKKFHSSVMPVNKTVDKPSLPKPPAMLPSVKANQRAYAPRPAPIRRPPSQPPPPPVPQFQHSMSIQEDYEIPISSSLVVTPVVSSLSQASLPPSSIVNKTPSSQLPEGQETYEVVQPPEEEYEIVSDLPNISTSSPIPVRPILPPRVSGSQPTNPPPLPEKPRKFQEVSPVPVSSSRRDSSVSNERQPLQKKIYDESSSSVLAGLLSGLNEMKQKSTVSSVKSEQCNSDSLSPSPNRVPRVSTVDKSEISPNSSLHSSKDKLTVDGTNPFPSHPVPAVTSQEDGGVINRPLPPVPSEAPRNIPLPEYSWFHDISREAAEEMLKQSQDGKFVVRPSKRAGEGNPYTLTLFHEGKIFHLNIRLRSDGTFALGKEKLREKTFGSVSELIEFHQKEPILISSKGESAGKSVLRTTVDKQ